MNTTVTPRICYEPIQQMTFKGLHWIEASAGTGKTFTLSSLMVRILLKDYLPNQVIATTFTRAAAAELKSRIRLRLIETKQYFEQCLSLSQFEIDQKIKQENDPLLKKVLSDYRDKVDYASSRLQLVLEQLDELFVGTLDSFSQKLLREFSFESGKIEHANITDQADDYTAQLVHDVLREWIQAQPQSMIDCLLLNKKLKASEEYLSIVRGSLNFSSAKIQTVEPCQLDLTIVEQALERIAALSAQDLFELKDYYDGPYTSNFSHYAAGKDGVHLRYVYCTALPALIEHLKTGVEDQWFNPNLSGHFQAIFSFCLDSKGQPRSKIFNKPNKVCTEELQNAFFASRAQQAIAAVVDAKLQLDAQFEAIDSYLKFHLTQEVKNRLPQLLEHKGETTFAQQIRTLADALQGEQGQRFAQFVHARYPLILVDEFQDTNQDQENMLSSIWRHPKWYERGCMIMVGDPKQAIYAFRGGDMLTYNNARRDVLAKQGTLYSLAQNHRSIKELVSVVDELFQREPSFGEQVHYSPVTAGPRPHPALIDDEAENPYPLRWLGVPEGEQESIKIAWKIRELLNQSQDGQLYFASKQGPQALTDSDIAILSTSHRSLDEVQYELERLGIRVNRSHKRSVFSGFLAQDVAAILTAILHPFDEAKVKRALLTRLLGYNLKQLIELEKQGLGQFIYDFDCIREMWMNKGFLTAWNYTLNLFKVWENLVTKKSFDNERLVVNLRHLSDLLSQHSARHQGAYMLYHWYLRQLESPGERDWEKERKLSNTGGVQLMTIHQSKGLEFKIVFLMGADKPAKKDSSALVFSTEQQFESSEAIEKRVISIREAATPDFAKQQHQERMSSERNRLWYVALTRASHRVYAMTQGEVEQSEAKTKTAKAKEDGLYFWRAKASISEEMQYLATEYSVDEQAPTEKPPFQATQKQAAIALIASEFPERRFYPRTKTSFSGLAQHLPTRQLSDQLVTQLTQEDAAADETDVLITMVQQLQQPIDWIKAQFPRGTQVGSFLHKLFENIGFQDDAQLIQDEVKRRFKNDKEFNSEAILNQLAQSLMTTGMSLLDAENEVFRRVTTWLIQVLNTPLHENFSLANLSVEMHLAEFPFYMALADQRLFIQAISKMFAEAGKPIHDLNEAGSARYLNGSIDLVYFDGQRYHIADYKSNFLGSDQAHYTAGSIASNMSHSSYWLQAALYLVAMHRYLKSQMPNYDIAQHLGGATYLYLRGMTGQAEQGYYYWKPSDSFVLQLDQILGYFSIKKPA